MADDPDFDALAKRYLDLWQGQLSALSSDRQLTETLTRLLATTNASMTAAFDAARRAHAATPDPDAAGQGRPASAAAASADGAAELGELRARLEAVERQLRGLEDRVAAIGAAARPKRRSPVKRKPAAET